MLLLHAASAFSFCNLMPDGRVLACLHGIFFEEIPFAIREEVHFHWKFSVGGRECMALICSVDCITPVPSFYHLVPDCSVLTKFFNL